MYLASFEAVSSKRNVTTLRIGVNLSCGIQSGATCIVDIIPVDNNNNASHRQIYNITEENNDKNMFNPKQVFLNFINIIRRNEYILQARLLSSEGDMIGPEFHTTIGVPFGM